jgi:hypothetical protein
MTAGLIADDVPRNGSIIEQGKPSIFMEGFFVIMKRQK